MRLCDRCRVSGCCLDYLGEACKRARERECPDVVYTNADHIRNMSDEELAMFQAQRYAESIFRDKEEKRVMLSGSAKKDLIDRLYRTWLRYLQQPYKEV